MWRGLVTLMLVPIGTPLLLAAPPPAGRADGALGATNREGLEIVGLGEMMTGWHGVQAVTHDPEIAYVEWRVNGRRVASEGSFSARLYFGQTPQRRIVEALGLAANGRPRLAKRTTVNGGGLATTLDFVSPDAGARLEGPTELRVCAAAPADRDLAQVRVEVRERGAEAGPGSDLQPIEGGRCRHGQMHGASLIFSPEPAVVTVKLLGREPTVTSRDRLLREESIVVNMAPGFSDRVDVRWLEWPVQVSKGKAVVVGLEAEHFELFEDYRPCPVREVRSREETPVRLGMIFDWSVSTAGDLAAEARAASEFLDRLFVAGRDTAFIAGIAATPLPLLRWSNDAQAISAALERVKAGSAGHGGSAVFDTLMQALYEFQSAEIRGTPAIVVMTDGYDTTSRYRREDVLAYAREAGVRIYPIAVRSRVAVGVHTGFDSAFLSTLADDTGGRLQVVTVDPAALELRQQAERLRHEALDLRRNPGELAADPRFLEYLVAERQAAAAQLEAKAAASERRQRPHLDRIREVFGEIRQDLETTYLVIGEGRATRSDRWHPVEVRLTNLKQPGKYRVRAPGGVFW